MKGHVRLVDACKASGHIESQGAFDWQRG